MPVPINPILAMRDNLVELLNQVHSPVGAGLPAKQAPR
jgi:hypothetical protein